MLNFTVAYNPAVLPFRASSIAARSASSLLWNRPWTRLRIIKHQPRNSGLTTQFSSRISRSSKGSAAQKLRNKTKFGRRRASFGGCVVSCAASGQIATPPSSPILRNGRLAGIETRCLRSALLRAPLFARMFRLPCRRGFNHSWFESQGIQWPSKQGAQFNFTCQHTALT